MSIVKQNSSLLGKKKYSYKNSRRQLQNLVCHLGAKSCCQQLAQELTVKLPVLMNFHSQKNVAVLTH